MAILKKIQPSKKPKKKLPFRKPFSFSTPIQEEEENQAIEVALKNPKPVLKRKKNKIGRKKIDPLLRRTQKVSAVITKPQEKQFFRLVEKSRLTKSDYIQRLIEQAIKEKLIL